MRFIILMALLAIGAEAVAQRRCCRVRPRVARGARSIYSSRVMDMVVSLASRERGPALTHGRSLCCSLWRLLRSPLPHYASQTVFERADQIIKNRSLAGGENHVRGHSS